MTSKKEHPGTIEEFGVQWTEFTENTGYYASTDVLDSLFGTLLKKEDLKGKRIADVGAGSGRYTRIFHQMKTAHITAIEPSAGFKTLQENTADLDNVELVNVPAADIPKNNFDWVFCIGVLQFIPDAKQALQAMGRALAADGRVLVWVYGRENNGIYLALLAVLRFFSGLMSHKVLDFVAKLLVYPASCYGWLCRFLPLPMADYLRGYYMKLDHYSRKLVVYDQLNPSMSIYYRRGELEQLFSEAGFTDIQFHHRLNTSWSVSARYVGG